MLLRRYRDWLPRNVTSLDAGMDYRVHWAWRLSCAFAVLFTLAVNAVAQQAAVGGTVADAMDRPLSGASVTALHEATGNTFQTVTDERGVFRVPVRAGLITVTVDQDGFSRASRRLNVLLGRVAITNFVMTAGTTESTLPEDGNVVDFTGSTLSGNIDPVQMQELPLNGRDWLDLTLLAPSSRLNAIEDTPVATSGLAWPFGLHLDGQTVTQILLATEQPRYSRDAISEFEFIGRYDATQGRSTASQVNAITKSGTNELHGNVSAFFRNDRFNAADPVVRTVLPYSNQQVSVTLGGPILRDKVHWFGSYEFEREPQTFAYTTPYPHFNEELTGTRRKDKTLFRVDTQISPRTRVFVRGTRSEDRQPYNPMTTGGSTRTPASASGLDLSFESFLVSFGQVLGTNTLNRIDVGHDYFGFQVYPHTPVLTGVGGALVETGPPQIRLRGLIVGSVFPTPPNDLMHDAWSFRDNLSFSFVTGGRHDIELGGEFFHYLHGTTVCVSCEGVLDARGGSVPNNLEEVFPDVTNPDTWDLTALSPIARFYRQSIVAERSTQSRPAGGTGFREYLPRNVYSGWVQDDWTIHPRLTLNLGLRYDLGTGVFANWVETPFLNVGRPNDSNNFAPRLGFAWGVTEETVLRGGWGLYFGEVQAAAVANTIRFTQRVDPIVLNDGRSDFAVNPFNGPTPTYEEAAQLQCSVTPGPDCLRPSFNNQAAQDLVYAYSHQVSIGVQRRLREDLIIDVDYSYSGERSSWYGNNINVAYDTDTGANYPFTEIANRPYPEWGNVFVNRSDGRSNYHGLQATFTKRMSNGWQASATYALDGLWIFDTLPLNPGCEYPVTLTAAGEAVCDRPIQLATDISENRYYLSGAQRHRVSANAVWQAGWGFQLSGIYLFGDQGKGTPNSGVDVRQTGGGFSRLREDGTLIPRNSFDFPSFQRLDLRIQRRFAVGGLTIDGILEVFNVFNHSNFDSFVLNETNPNFGMPSPSTNLAFAPRMLQLGLRMMF